MCDGHVSVGLSRVLIQTRGENSVCIYVCECVCVGSLRDRVPVVITKQERGEQQMRLLRWMASLQRDFKNSNLLTSANRKQCFVFLLLA